MDNIRLLGAEEVSSAARQMRSAAEEMKQAALNFDGSVFALKSFMDDWLIRAEQVLLESKNGKW